MAACPSFPVTLLNVRGQPKDPPPALRHIFRCAVCHQKLVRTPTGCWTCWQAGHTKLIEESVLLARCEQVIRGRRFKVMKAKRILAIQRRIQRWLTKGARE